MSPEQVIKHFGGPGARVAKAAKQLGCSRQAVYRWIDDGEVPLLRQYKIHDQTKGALKVSKVKA